MGFLDGLISPLLTQTANARGAYVAGQKQENDKQVANSLQLLTLKRQAKKDALAEALGRAQIDHLNSQTEGVWDKPFQGEDENGPGFFHQHKITGAVERIQVGGGVPPVSQPAAATPSVTSNAGGRASDMLHDVPGDIDLNDMGKYTAPSAAQDTTSKKVGAGGTPLRPLPKAPTQPPMNSPEWRAAEAYKASLVPKPAPTNVYLAGTDPNTNQPTIFAGSSKGPPTLTNMGVGKPVGAGGGGQSLSPEDREKMKAQAALDNATMKAYEEKVLKSGQAPGTIAGIAGAAAGNTATGMGAQITGILGNRATGAIDPDYQRYITAQRSYGRIMGNLQSKRYTDHQAEIERSISGLQGNDLEGTIRYKQHLRDAALADPITASPQGGGRAGGGQPSKAPAPTPGTATRAQQLWDAAVAKHGKEKVLQEYGPRPDE